MSTWNPSSMSFCSITWEIFIIDAASDKIMNQWFPNEDWRRLRGCIVIHVSYFLQAPTLTEPRLLVYTIQKILARSRECRNLHHHDRPLNPLEPMLLFLLTVSPLLEGFHGHHPFQHCQNLRPDVHLTPYLNQNAFPGFATNILVTLEHCRQAFQERAGRLLNLPHPKFPVALIKYDSKLREVMMSCQTLWTHRKREKGFVRVGKLTWKSWLGMPLVMWIQFTIQKGPGREV